MWGGDKVTAAAGASRSGVGVGPSTVAALAASLTPGVMERIQAVIKQEMTAKTMGARIVTIGPRLWKKRAYWRHAGSL